MNHTDPWQRRIYINFFRKDHYSADDVKRFKEIAQAGYSTMA